MDVYLSIVIPAYNEELRITSTLEEIFAYLAQQTYTAEIIVVDDGSDDRTSQIVAPFCGTVPPVHLLQNSAGNRGKGFSVRNGFLHARGEYLLFSDADLSTPMVVGSNCPVPHFRWGRKQETSLVSIANGANFCGFGWFNV
jgi:dolichyl-phosphate beta-glucosyltransferase